MKSDIERVELLPCPFCGGEPNLWDGRGTQADIECDCGLYRSIQVSDYFTREERFDDPNFQWVDNEVSYAPEGVKRGLDELTKWWNTRAQQNQASGAVDAKHIPLPYSRTVLMGYWGETAIENLKAPGEYIDIDSGILSEDGQTGLIPAFARIKVRWNTDKDREEAVATADFILEACNSYYQRQHPQAQQSDHSELIRRAEEWCAADNKNNFDKTDADWKLVENPTQLIKDLLSAVKGK